MFTVRCSKQAVRASQQNILTKTSHKCEPGFHHFTAGACLGISLIFFKQKLQNTVLDLTTIVFFCYISRKYILQYN